MALGSKLVAGWARLDLEPLDLNERKGGGGLIALTICLDRWIFCEWDKESRRSFDSFIEGFFLLCGFWSE